MPKRIMAILLCLAAAACGLTGCGHKTEITGQPADTAINNGQTETAVSGTAEATAELPTEESLFDADKALENTYLCGVQLAPGMTWGMLGEDFSVDDGDTSYSEKKDSLSCRLVYKGQYVGGISFRNCRKTEDITADSKIGYFLIKNDDMDKFDVQKISVAGVSLNDSRGSLYSALGEPQLEYGEDKSVKYYGTDDSRIFNFAFTDDRIQFVFISL